MTYRFFYMLFLFLLMLTVTCADLSAQGYDYMNPDPAVSSISPELTAGADAVIRLHHKSFEVDDPGEGRVTVKKMVTILNSDGLPHSSIRIPYNSFSDVSRISGAVYDADGEEVRSIRNKDFEDESMISSFSLAEDSRVIKGEFTHTSFPFTIEYSYHIDYSGFIQLPAWVPVEREKTALEFGELLVVLPSSMSFDYRKFNIPDENEFGFQDDSESRYRWELKNLPQVKREYMGPPWFRLFPAVVMKTDLFEMDGNRGRMDSWSVFGQWFGNLWQGRDDLPVFVKQDVDRLIETHGKSRDLIEAIYSSLQNETRYVSIQLGIGGFQTETAEFTAINRYGDCKALSNYLLAMLQYAGFDARPALIRNGGFSFPFDPEFVHNPFNHAVIAVQFEGERIWVEATSSSYPLGYLGSSNSNRHALLFDESGGELVETPDQQHRYIRNNLPFNLFEVNSYQATADSAQPSAELEMNISVETFANKIGSRLMFHPNVLERYNNFVAADENRQQPVNISMAYHDVDEVTFNLPEGFVVEALPDSVGLNFDFGSYSAVITPSEDGTYLTYIREIAMKPATIPADEFDSFRETMNNIWASDNNQVVIVKK